MAVYDLGDQVDLETFVHDDDGDAATATVVLTITLPDGTTTTPTVATDSTGHYTGSYKPTLAGTHYVRWVGTSVGGVSGEDTSLEDAFTVSSSSNTYLALDDAKQYLNFQGTASDAELSPYLEIACDIAQQVADTQFARLTVVDTLSPRCGQVSLQLSKRPVISVTSVTENGTALTTSTGYITDLRWGRIFRQAGAYTDAYWWEGRRNVVATYVAGYAIVPTPVMFATATILGHIWETQRGPATSAPFSRDDVYQVPGTNWYIPNKARDVLFDYRPPTVA